MKKELQIKVKIGKQVSANSQSLYNIASNVILSGINFLTIPIFTRFLGAAQYGLYSVFHSWVVIVMCFICLECGSGLGTARYVFSEKYQEYKSSSLMFGIIIAMVFIVIAIVFRNQLSCIIGYPSSIVVLIFITAFFSYMVSFAQNSFIYEKRADKNLILSVSVSILSIFLSLWFIKAGYFEEPYLARAYGNTIPFIGAAIIVTLFTFLKTFPHYNKLYWKYCFGMGFPIVFHGLSQNILKQSDRIMMQHMGYTETDVGVYSFFGTYTAILSILLTALNTTWCPFYYDDLHESAYEVLKVKCKNYIELFTVIVCGFLLLSREVCYILSGSEYWIGMRVIPLLTIGIYFIFMYQFPVNFEFYNKKTTIIAIGTFSAAGINILLNLLLIPGWGMYGAALATAISYAILFTAHYIIASHMKEMKFHIKMRSFFPGLAAVLSFSILFYSMDRLWAIRWGLGIVLGIIEIIRIIKRKSVF